MEQLLAAGADPTIAADGGATPLHAAAEAGQLDSVLLLLKVLTQNPQCEQLADDLRLLQLPQMHGLSPGSLHVICLLCLRKHQTCMSACKRIGWDAAKADCMLHGRGGLRSTERQQVVFALLSNADSVIFNLDK